MDTNTRKVLIVEDEPLVQRVLSSYLLDGGFKPSIVGDAEQAWDVLREEASDYDAMLLDVELPGMDGLELLRRVKRHKALKALPVIMQTTEVSMRSVVEGLKAGAYYYLPKPADKQLLLTVLSAAIDESGRYKALLDALQQAQQGLKLIRSGEFEFRTLEECRHVTSLLASACPNPEKVLVGLSELMVNAIEHGNLGISFDEKTRLLERSCWEAEILNRLKQPVYAQRIAEASFKRTDTEILITITDQGAGFNWRNYQRVNLAAMFNSHGRGIALAREFSFDSVSYNEAGNQVTCCLRTTTVH